MHRFVPAEYAKMCAYRSLPHKLWRSNYWRQQAYIVAPHRRTAPLPAGTLKTSGMEGQSAALPHHSCLDGDEKENELLEPFMHDSEEEIRKWRADGVGASKAARRATRFEEAQFRRGLESERFSRR